MNGRPKPVDLEETARALLDPRAPVSDPALQFVQLAMTGFGYNFYDARNVARANDLLVRGRASESLGAAGEGLDRLQRAYLAATFPSASREQPYPPPGVMRNVRSIEELRKRALRLASAMTAAETPATDSIWFRFRDEGTLLQSLVAYDVALATGSDAVAAAAAVLTRADVEPEALVNLDAELTKLELAFAGRRDLLRGTRSDRHRIDRERDDGVGFPMVRPKPFAVEGERPGRESDTGEIGRDG